MALTRSALREKGITEKEILDYIMEEHGNTVEATKEKAKETAENAAQKTIDTLQAKVDGLPEGGGEDWKAKYDAEVIAHKATVDGHTTEKTNAATDEKVMAHLIDTVKMHKSAAKNALKQYDRSIVEFDKDGNIKNADKVTEHFKADWSDFFGKVETKGANVATPPKGEENKTDTHKGMNAFIRGEKGD